MKRSGHIPWGKLRVGLLLLVALLLFLWAAFTGGFFKPLQHYYELRTAFTNVQGLVTGSPVWVNGLEVGQVKSIALAPHLQENQVEVTVRLKREVWPYLRTDSKIRVGTIGLLGDKYIEIFAGSDTATKLPPGAFLPAEKPVDAQAMFAEATESLRRLTPLLDDIAAMTRKMRSGRSSIGRLIDDQKLYDDLVEATGAITRVVKNIDRGQEQALTRMANAAASLDTLAKKLYRGEGSAGKLVTDTALYTSLAHVAGQADTLFGKIGRGEGALGKLTQEEQLYAEISKLVTELDRLVTDIKAHPKKYFKFSIF